MLTSLLYSLLRALLDVIATSHGDQAQLQAEVLALRRQVQVLERQIKRVRWTPGDRMLMAALRNHLSQSAWAGLLIRPETVLGWQRTLVRRKWAAYLRRTRRGRPRISTECRELIVRMARENRGWGYFRIRGELLKLGHAVAATTIRSVLVGAGVPPSGRRAGMTWKQFLAAHAQTLVAADFLSVDTVFFKRLYVLIYMHLATRRILLASCTANPNEAWVTQQARNLLWTLDEEGIKLNALIHDRDKKFASRADKVFRSAGTRVIVTPLMAPRANAQVERWIGSCRRECLDWMLVVSQRHLETILREYCTHYNQERPHRSRELRPPAARGDPVVARTRRVRRRVRLGGLISEYYREAVAA
ncbi:MAG TPA: integrase core domain-containing protein [Candidatus Dormibacteraeota bacterium]|nr:integrase core domain-containing protein [Candidatus Dormibacteraeota bacterium]